MKRKSCTVSCIFIMMIVIITFLSGCKNTEKDLKSIIQTEITGMNNGDITKYMSTIDSKSPDYDATKQAMLQFFGTYKIKATLNSFQVISESDNQAQGRTVITFEVEGLKKTQSTYLLSFNKVNGKWKIYSTKTEKTEELSD